MDKDHAGLEAGDDTQRTNPFPPGYVESRLQLDSLVKDHVQKYVRIDQLELDRQLLTPPITQLLRRKIDRCPPFRLRFRHGRGNEAIEVGDAEPWWILAPPKMGIAGSDGGNVDVLGVVQRSSDWRCPLTVGRSIECDIVYDPDSDNVVVHNKSSFLLSVQPLSNDKSALPVQVEPWGAAAIAVGLWEFTSEQETVEVEVLPRQYRLHVEQSGSPSVSTGSKRSLSPEEEELPQRKKARSMEGSPTISNTGSAPPSEIMPRPECSSRPQSAVVRNSQETMTAGFQLEPGQSLCVVNEMTGNTEYSFRRLSQWEYSTPSSDVFRAILKKGSQKGEVVIVKMIKAAEPNRDAAVLMGGANWWHEYYINQQVNHPHIASMVGFDARIRCFYFEHRDARDLASAKWCFSEGDERPHHFRGTSEDASCILADIASALAHLGEKETRIVHGDIKPGNILYHRNTSGPGQGGGHPSRATRPGAALIDFGVAAPEATPEALSGSTPWYMAPELGKKRLSHCRAADIYALGVVMLYLLGRMGLPERVARQSRWDVAEYRNGGPMARKLASMWHEQINALRDGLKLTPDCTDTEIEIMALVRAMLVPVGQRITAEQLEQATRKWASTTGSVGL